MRKTKHKSTIGLTLTSVLSNAVKVTIFIIEDFFLNFSEYQLFQGLTSWDNSSLTNLSKATSFMLQWGGGGQPPRSYCEFFLSLSLSPLSLKAFLRPQKPI